MQLLLEMHYIKMYAYFLFLFIVFYSRSCFWIFCGKNERWKKMDNLRQLLHVQAIRNLNVSVSWEKK